MSESPPESNWQRQCALCGTVDAEHAWAEPVDDGMAWHCPRCEAVRWLWQPLPQPAAGTQAHRRTG